MKVSQILKTAMKRGLILAVVALTLVSCCFSASASTFVPYSTYTYDFEGEYMISSHAYVADRNYTPKDMGLITAFTNPSDLFIDSEGNVYVVDTDNSRVVFLSPELDYRGEINTFPNEAAIVPTIKEKLETEAEAETFEETLTRRLKKYREDEENPVDFTVTAEQLVLIEERLAAAAAKAADEANEALEAGFEETEPEVAEEPEAEPEEGEEAAEGEGEEAEEEPEEAPVAPKLVVDEYAAIVAEYAETETPVTADLAHMLDLIQYVMPIKYKFDCLNSEQMEFGAEMTDKEDEIRYFAYYNEYLMGVTGEDPSVDALSAPEGLFVAKDGTLYVADTGNKRVVKFHHENKESWLKSDFVVEASFKRPESSVLEEEFEFHPQNLVVDAAGRMYVNVKNVNEGIMQLSAQGEFMGYFGAQKVTGSVFQWFFSLFQSDEQRARTVRIVPRVYNNISIDDKNFVWITANSMDNFDLFSYLSSGDSGTAPIKRLNPSGNDVLVRNGLWSPGGDIPVDTNDVSSIVDVTVKGDTGIYTLVDDKRNKLFTYDSDGNLLYAFGGTGSQLGVFKLVGAAVYQGTDMLVLDKQTGYITRFKQTAYATAIETALTADNQRDYEASEAAWKQVQKLNSNYDQAYVGLAKCYLHRAAQADTEEAKELYKTAMEYYKLARNTEGYSKAYKEYRSLYVRDHLLLVLAVPIVLLVLIFFGIRALNKVNSKMHITGTQTTLKEELCFGWRVIFHPIAGFWELKREQRGSMRAAIIFLIGAVIAFCFKATGTAYLFNNVNVAEISIIQQACNVLIPVVLWVLASWSFTTLMSGEGSMKDIFIALCYALIPLILILIPVTLASNICSLDEEPFLTFFTALAYGWMGVLVVFGSMVIQDYTFGKNLLTVILSVLGMAAIMFIVLLLFSLTGKLWGFIETLIKEVAYRL